MNETRFWSMIEEAWGMVGGKAKSRQRLAEGKLSEDRAYALQETLEEEVVPALREQLATLPADELLAFDRWEYYDPSATGDEELPVWTSDQGYRALPCDICCDRANRPSPRSRACWKRWPRRAR